MRDHVDDLIARGFASFELFERLDRLWDDLDDVPACLVCFQLPFKLHVGDLPYVVRSPRQAVAVTLHFSPITIAVGDRLKYRVVSDRQKEAEAPSLSCECTQCVAVVPLWGVRNSYYSAYLEALRRGSLQSVVIPYEHSPYQAHMVGSVTAEMFEVDTARRAAGETVLAIRRLLKHYAVTTLHEVERPTELLSLFASTADGRYFPFGSLDGVLRGMLRPTRSIPLKVATPEDIRIASRWELRGFSVFELQIFALRRLADDGDPGLALIGLCALMEWLLSEHLPVIGKVNLSLGKLLDHEHYRFLDESVRSTIHMGRKTRNLLVHERPNETRYVTSTLSHFSDADSLDPSAASTLKVFQAVALASFECFRLINLKGARGSRPIPPSDSSDR